MLLLPGLSFYDNIYWQAMVSKNQSLLKTLLLAGLCNVGYVAPLLSQNSQSVKNILIGKSQIFLHKSCFKRCDTKLVLINLHDDENTSIEAAEKFLADNGGTLYQLKHTNGRTITFTLDSKNYTFDPNRIFTPTGIKNSLKSYRNYSLEAERKIKLFAGSLLKSLVVNKRLLVSMHNNSDSLFSVLSYKNLKLEGRNALKVYVNKNMDSDDFVYTSASSVFNHLKAKKINVVLQNNKTVKDDGSLSFYAARHKIRYINIEAQTGHFDEQLRMLNALKIILKAE